MMKAQQQYSTAHQQGVTVSGIQRFADGARRALPHAKTASSGHLAASSLPGRA